MFLSELSLSCVPLEAGTRSEPCPPVSPLAMTSLGPLTAGARPGTTCPYVKGAVLWGESMNRAGRPSRWPG